MSVDYRLLHHFRVSQRREMASRGEVPVLRPDGQAAGERGVERRAAETLPELPAPLEAPPLARPRGQVLTHLLNEDR
jgi:hypothetical protein